MSDHTAPSLPTLHIADLGPLVVRVDGVEAALPGPKLKEVFLRLAMANGESVSFDTLISDLWPGRDRLRARRNLQQQVYNLRAALGQDRIELVGSSYRVRREGTERDSLVADDGYHAARRLAELDPTAARERVKEVLDRFRGPPLAEFASADWARADAAQLDQLHESLRILDYQLRLQSNDDSLIAELKVLTDQHSENERYWAFLMTALYRAGRQEEALRAFQSARRRLRDRFGLQPGPALVELERQILTQAPELMRGTDELPPGSLNSCQCWTQGLASPLVGRDREVARLRAAVDGGTDLVLISGESGIGKSRLARELATEAAQRSVFYGTCDRSLGRSFPPIADIVEHAEQHNPGLIDGLESQTSVDALRRLTEVAPADETHSSRNALVAALAALLRAATDDLPPLLIVDQLQDADPDTLEVLGRLVGPMSGVKVCVVGITQPAGLTADATLARWLRALPNEVVVDDIALGPLTSEQVCDLAAALAPPGDGSPGSGSPGDSTPGEIDCDDLLARSGGNPLFLTHLLAETVGDETTPQLGRVAWRRIARRSKEAIALLRAAAIDGLRPQGWLMVELSGLDHEVAAAALAEVLQDGLLLPTTPGSEDEPGASDRYWFTHGLLQRSLLEEIGPALCQAQHRRAAELMVARREAGNAIASGAIAAQFLKAAPLAGRGPAIDWLVRSAASAVGDSAYDRAMAQLRHALSLVSDSSEDDELAAELLTELGTVMSTYVHEGDGRAVLIEAIGRARRAGRVDLVARAALQVGGVLPAGDAPDPIAEELLGGALAGLGDNTPHLRAELTARLAQLRYWDASVEDRLALCAEADRLCSEADGAVPSAPPDVALRVGINRYWACAIDQDLTTAWDLIGHLSSLAERSGDKLLALQVTKCRLFTSLDSGDVEAADSLAARFTDAANELGSPDLVRLGHLYGALRAGSRGDLTAADELAGRSFALLNSTGRELHAEVVDQLVRLPWRWLTGQHEEVLEFTGGAMELAPELQLWQLLHAWFRVLDGDEEGGRELALRFDPAMDLNDGMRQDRWVVTAAATLLAQRLQLTTWAKPLTDYLAHHANVAVHLGQTVFLGFGWHYLALAEALDGSAEGRRAAIDSLGTALDASTRIEAKPWALFAELELARLGAGVGGARPDPASIADRADALGCTWLATEARALS